MGSIVIGKVESGGCKKGEILLVMPNKVNIIHAFLCKEFLRIFIYIFTDRGKS